jgi:hypothetical protein
MQRRWKALITAVSILAVVGLFGTTLVGPLQVWDAQWAAQVAEKDIGAGVQALGNGLERVGGQVINGAEYLGKVLSADYQTTFMAPFSTWSLNDWKAADMYLQNLTPQQYKTFSAQHPAFTGDNQLTQIQVDGAFCFLGCTAFNWYTNLAIYVGAFIAGCATGAVLLAESDPFTFGTGSLVGCVTLGLIGVSLAVIALESYANSNPAANNIPKTLKGWTQSFNNIETNSVNLDTELSTLNASVYALGAEADAEALYELGYPAFNFAQDLSATNVTQQMASVLGASLASAAFAAIQFNDYINGNYAPDDTGSVFLGSNTYWKASSGATSISLGDVSGTTTLAGGVGVTQGVQTTSSGTAPYFTATDSTKTTNGTLAPDVSYLLVGNGGSCSISAPANYTAQGWTGTKNYFSSQYVNWTTWGIYQLHLTSGSLCELTGNAILPTSLNSQSVETGAITPEFVFCNIEVVSSGGPPSPCAAQIIKSTSDTVLPMTANSEFYNSTGNVTQPTPLGGYFANEWAYSDKEFAQLTYVASTTAEVYWSYLNNTAKYTNIDQIPPSCVIPYPAQALGSDWNNVADELTFTQTQSLYYAWMEGEAQFYNSTTFNPSEPCRGYANFDFTATSWNVWVQATGYVYIPYSVGYPDEKFLNYSNPSYPINNQTPSAEKDVFATWGLNGSDWTQLQTPLGVPLNGSTSCWVPYIANGKPPSLNCTAEYAQSSSLNPLPFTGWPISDTNLYVPVEKTYEIPNGSVAEIMTLGSTAVLPHVTGNGTAKGYVSQGNTPGYAMYITSCSVNGTSVTVCPFEINTIQGVYSELQGCQFTNSCGNISLLLNCGEGLFIVGPFVSALYDAFGSVGCDIAWLIIIVVLVVIIYAAVVVIGKVRGHPPRNMGA